MRGSGVKRICEIRDNAVLIRRFRCLRTRGRGGIGRDGASGWGRVPPAKAHACREVTMPPTGIAAGVLSAISFGAGDFAGAVAARRAGALIVVAGAHSVGLIALLIGAVIVRPPLPEPSTMLVGLGAGVAGAIGLAALYRGMSLGSMGLVASLSGAGSLALPLVAGGLLGSRIAPLQFAGVFCAAAAAAAAGGASRDEVGRRALALAAAAALGFGTWYVLLDLAARGGDPLWALVFSRGMSAALTVAIAAGRFDRSRFPARVVVAAGVLDVGGNALYVVARDLMPIGLAAALTGLYPIVTMLLARLVLGEHVPRLGQLGVALAMLGIVLISLGG
jgi:drug/metabolite transporter (DMT)-like permease